MSEVLQILGAAAILAAFVAVQKGTIEPQSVVSLVLNLAGSGLLAVLAALGSQWGFVLLEASWAGISLLGVGARLRARIASRA